MDVTATAPAEEEERAPFRISFFVVYPKSRALVLLYRQFPRSLALALALSLSLALALALSLSFSLFALSFKRGGYQSLLSTQETLSVDDRRCEEEVLFYYAKEGAGPISTNEKNKHQMPKMPNAKCQITDQSKKKQKKEIANTNTKQNKNKNKNSQSREERGMKPTSDRSERSVSP